MQITITDDRLWKSVVSDVFSFVTLMAMVGVGWFVDSSALQWIGGIIWCIWLMARLSQSKKKFMSVTLAREYLDKLERRR